jgi:Bacteriophage HK97-gp10, putative tail-component
MANHLRLSGFRELRRDLAALPEDSRTAAEPILLAHARRAETALHAAYPFITGALRDGVRIVKREARGIAALFTVRSDAPHAHLYEFGTAHTRPHAAFLPITEEQRRAAVRDVAAMVERTGLQVRGERD